jgi:glc operon protein GlcG
MLPYARARAIVEHVLARTQGDGGKPIAVAVVDDRGDLVAFARQDGVTHRSLRIAQDKAYTSALQESSTKDFVEFLARTDRQVSVFADPRYVALAGGVPISDAGARPLGAVGVSGRSSDEDHQLASDAVAAR